MDSEWVYYENHKRWMRPVYDEQARKWRYESRQDRPQLRDRVDSGCSSQSQPGLFDVLAGGPNATPQGQMHGLASDTFSSTQHQNHSHYSSNSDMHPAPASTSNHSPGYYQLPGHYATHAQSHKSSQQAHDAHQLPLQHRPLPSSAAPDSQWGSTHTQYSTQPAQSPYLQRSSSFGGVSESIPHETGPNLRVSGGRQGGPINGNYRYGETSHYESLDTSYYVRDRAFFAEGRVFSILFTEPAGATSNPTNSYNTSLSLVKFGEYAFTQVRRFIVVRSKREFCFACPIFTYSGRGTKKDGVHADEHAIAYSYGQQPTPLDGEEEMDKTPICIVNAPGIPALDRASRIYFGIHHPIQYNVKAKDLGLVHENHISSLIQYWKSEFYGIPGQGVEETVQPIDEYPG